MQTIFSGWPPSAMAAILDFQSQQFKIFLIYKSPRCFLPSFKSSGLLVQDKKRKIDFQDGATAAILDFRSRPSWISNQNDFSYFLSTGQPDASY